MSATAPHVLACSECTYQDRIIRLEVRRNERRRAAGLSADMSAIDKAKQDKADCAAREHTDSRRGPSARWGSR